MGSSAKIKVPKYDIFLVKNNLSILKNTTKETIEKMTVPTLQKKTDSIPK